MQNPVLLFIDCDQFSLPTGEAPEVRGLFPAGEMVAIQQREGPGGSGRRGLLCVPRESFVRGVGYKPEAQAWARWGSATVCGEAIPVWLGVWLDGLPKGAGRSLMEIGRKVNEARPHLEDEERNALLIQLWRELVERLESGEVPEGDRAAALTLTQWIQYIATGEMARMEGENPEQWFERMSGASEWLSAQLEAANNGG